MATPSRPVLALAALALALAGWPARAGAVDVESAARPAAGPAAPSRFSLAAAPALPGLARFEGTLRFVRYQGGLVGGGSGGAFQPRWRLLPSLALDVGHYLDASANRVLRRFRMVPDDTRVALEGLGYAFASATAGVELAGPAWLVLYVRAGLSRLAFDATGKADGRGGCDRSSGEGALARAERRGGALFMPVVKAGLLARF